MHIRALLADVEIFYGLVYEATLVDGQRVNIRAPSIVSKVPAVAVYRSLEVACGELVGYLLLHTLTGYRQLSLHVYYLLAELQLRVVCHRGKVGALRSHSLTKCLSAHPSWLGVVALRHVEVDILSFQEVCRYVLQVVYCLVKPALRHIVRTDEVVIVVGILSDDALSPFLQFALARLREPFVIVSQFVATHCAQRVVVVARVVVVPVVILREVFRWICLLPYIAARVEQCHECRCEVLVAAFLIAWHQLLVYESVEHLTVVVVFARLLLFLRCHPFHLSYHPFLVVFLRKSAAACRCHHADGTGIVLHPLGTVKVHSLVQGLHRLVVLSVEILQLSDGSLPQGGTLGLTLLQHRVGKADERIHVFLVGYTCVDHPHPFIVNGYHIAVLVCGIRVECLLCVVHEVLHQVVEHRHVGVFGIYCLYACDVTILAHTPLHAEHVLLLGKHVACLDALARVQQCSGIDILHHILVHARLQLRCRLLPVSDVCLVLAQHHVGTHPQQLPLVGQSSSTMGIRLHNHLRQVLLSFLQLLLRGIVPCLSQLLTDVQVFAQFHEILGHLLVAPALGIVGNLLLVPLPLFHRSVGVALPELIQSVGEQRLIHCLPAEHAEQVVVMGSHAPAAGESLDCRHQHHKTNC